MGFRSLGVVLLTCAVVACSSATPAPPAAPEDTSPRPNTSQEVASGAVFVGCGFVYAGNAGSAPFSAFLKGTEAQTVQGNDNALILDGVFLEIQLVTADQIGAPSLRGNDLLIQHLRWELDYTAKTNKWPRIEPKGTKDLGIPNLPTVGWMYETPAVISIAGQEVDHMFYATAAVDNVVFVLAAPIRS